MLTVRSRAFGGLGVGFAIGIAWGLYASKMGRGAVLGLLLGVFLAMIFGWRRS